MAHRHLSALPVLLLLAACPAETSQVEHFMPLAARPDIACVESRLHDIAKGNRVQSIRETIPNGGVSHRLNFETSSAPHSIGILFAADGSYTFRSTAWAAKQTLSELRAARQSLFDVDAALDGRCGLGPIVGNVEEACTGENCERLAASTGY